MAGKKGMKPYPLELKLEALRLYNEEGKTRAEITALLEWNLEKFRSGGFRPCTGGNRIH